MAKITMCNFKGGMGKTTIALNLALTLPGNYGIITNEIYSPIEDVLPEENFIKIPPNKSFPKINQDINIIYDLGGYVDTRTRDIIKDSDIILCPTVVNYIDLKVALNCIGELEQFNKNIIVIGNKTQKKNDFQYIKKAIRKFYQYPVLEIKMSQAMPNIFKFEKSIADMVAEGGLKKYHYNSINKQFETIIKHIKEF